MRGAGYGAKWMVVGACVVLGAVRPTVATADARLNDRATADLKARATLVVNASRWLELKSANFLVAGDVREGELRDVARRLEEFREALSRLIPDGSFGDAPTIVIVFPDQGSYRPFAPIQDGKPIRAAGFFQPGADLNYVCIVLDRGADSYPVVFHELTHVFASATFGEVPVWLAEGLAEFYASFEVSNDGRQAKVGKPIQAHVDLLDSYWLPLDQVLAAAPSSPLLNNWRTRDVFYAECWAVMHYLLAGPTPRGPHFAQFLERVNAGDTPDAACRTAFGLPLGALEREARTYVRQRAFTWQRVSFAEPLASKASGPVQKGTASAAEARLGDLLWHMTRYDEAQARLENALRLEPEQALARASLEGLRRRRLLLAERADGPRPAAPPGREAIPAGDGAVYYVRALVDGEQRTFGSLERIDCESARVLFHVRSGDRLLRFTAASMEGVQFLMYRDDLSRRIECGARTPADPVYVTWRAGKGDGEAVAVEFLPKDYVPK